MATPLNTFKASDPNWNLILTSPCPFRVAGRAFATKIYCLLDPTHPKYPLDIEIFNWILTVIVGRIDGSYVEVCVPVGLISHISEYCPCVSIIDRVLNIEA